MNFFHKFLIRWLDFCILGCKIDYILSHWVTSVFNSLVLEELSVADASRPVPIQSQQYGSDDRSPNVQQTNWRILQRCFLHVWWLQLGLVAQSAITQVLLLSIPRASSPRAPRSSHWKMVRLQYCNQFFTVKFSPGLFCSGVHKNQASSSKLKSMPECNPDKIIKDYLAKYPKLSASVQFRMSNSDKHPHRTLKSLKPNGGWADPRDHEFCRLIAANKVWANASNLLTASISNRQSFQSVSSYPSYLLIL